jgi:sterol desaturase/sphingolipid hydroxylase (fatty acid hydroxylase superfamily)
MRIKLMIIVIILIMLREHITQHFLIVFNNPQSRFSWYFILLTYVSAFVYYLYVRKKLGYSFFKDSFSKRNFFSMSVYVDIVIFSISAFYVFDLLFDINPDDVYTFGQDLISISHRGFLPDLADNPFIMMLWTVVRLVVGDFAYYVYHWLMHNVRSLWFFHAVHHSATSLNLLTAYRLHPVDAFFSNLILGLAGAAYAALTMIFFGKGSLNLLIFGFVFYMPLRAVIANLRHSQIWWRFPDWLSRVIMSPAQHQIHHSKDPNDFAFYDQIFGTLYIPTEKDYDELRVGIDEKEHRINPGSFYSCMWQPFVNLYNYWRDKINCRPKIELRADTEEYRETQKSS